MTSTLDSSTEQTPISFKDPTPVRGRRGWNDWDDEDQFGIWSCKFSADGNEIVAGGREMIFGVSAFSCYIDPYSLLWSVVYDLLAERRTVKIKAHEDDINSCCWADTASGNILISGSDDSFLKVW